MKKKAFVPRNQTVIYEENAITCNRYEFNSTWPNGLYVQLRSFTEFNLEYLIVAKALSRILLSSMEVSPHSL